MVKAIGNNAKNCLLKDTSFIKSIITLFFLIMGKVVVGGGTVVV